MSALFTRKEAKETYTSKTLENVQYVPDSLSDDHEAHARRSLVERNHHITMPTASMAYYEVEASGEKGPE